MERRGQIDPFGTPFYKITPKIGAGFGLGLHRFDDGIKGSPLTDERWRVRVLAGAAYLF